MCAFCVHPSRLLLAFYAIFSFPAASHPSISTLCTSHTLRCLAHTFPTRTQCCNNVLHTRSEFHARLILSFARAAACIGARSTSTLPRCSILPAALITVRAARTTVSGCNTINIISLCVGLAPLLQLGPRRRCTLSSHRHRAPDDNRSPPLYSGPDCQPSRPTLKASIPCAFRGPTSTRPCSAHRLLSAINRSERF